MAEKSGPSGGNGRIRCVIYDCDGVLFDSLEANRRFYNDLCCAVRGIPLSDEELRYGHIHTTREAIRYFFGNNLEWERRALEHARQFDPGEYVAYLVMEPHLLPTLRALGEKGVFRAINTNRTLSMKAIIDNFHLGPFFELVTTARDVTHPKPHPESVQKIVSTLGVDTPETLFVGDSEIDQKTAQSAGVRFIAYKNPELQADAYIEDHREILKIIRCPEPEIPDKLPRSG